MLKTYKEFTKAGIECDINFVNIRIDYKEKIKVFDI